MRSGPLLPGADGVRRLSALNLDLSEQQHSLAISGIELDGLLGRSSRVVQFLLLNLELRKQIVETAVVGTLLDLRVQASQCLFWLFLVEVVAHQ